MSSAFNILKYVKWYSIFKKGMLLFFLAMNSMALAQNTERDQNGHLILRINPNHQDSEFNQSADFTAAQYFAPIQDGDDRSAWPEKLTLEPYNSNLTIEEFKKKMIGQWKLVFHCEGKAIPAINFINSDFYNGIYRPALIIEFGITDTLTVTRKFYKAGFNLSYSKEDLLDTRELMVINEEFNINYRYPLRLNFLEHIPVVYRFIKVRETNEILIETDTDNSSSDLFICPNNQKYKPIFVPFYLLSS